MSLAKDWNHQGFIAIKKILLISSSF